MAGLSFRLQPEQDCTDFFRERKKPLNQRIQGDCLLIDEIFENVWEFPATSVKERKVTRGDLFIGDLRIDFDWNGQTRTLCRVCGKHVLKSKFATEHYKQNISCWKEVMKKLSITDFDGLSQAGSSVSGRSRLSLPRSAIDASHISVPMMEGLLGSACENLFLRAHNAACAELRQFRTGGIEIKQEEETPELYGFIENTAHQFGYDGSNNTEPWFKIEVFHPNAFVANRNNSYSYTYLKLRFNAAGARHLQELFKLDFEFLIEFGEGTLMVAKRFTLREADNNPAEDPDFGNLKRQGFAFLKTHVPMKQPEHIQLKLRIPKNLFEWYIATCETQVIEFKKAEDYCATHLQASLSQFHTLANTPTYPGSYVESPSPDRAISNQLLPPGPPAALARSASAGSASPTSHSQAGGWSPHPHPHRPPTPEPVVLRIPGHHRSPSHTPQPNGLAYGQPPGSPALAPESAITVGFPAENGQQHGLPSGARTPASLLAASMAETNMLGERGGGGGGGVDGQPLQLPQPPFHMGSDDSGGYLQQPQQEPQPQQQQAIGFGYPADHEQHERSIARRASSPYPQGTQELEAAAADEVMGMIGPAKDGSGAAAAAAAAGGGAAMDGMQVQDAQPHHPHMVMHNHRQQSIH
ncbi:unnamed protein product [Vitrella brassicaformis CCMP3155]|uniref:Uncharacterized protein n=2 Tax=Vitrella brassicaformis TaxID=1169539 RepID=A0A0G4F8J9_VITBC|nr:unnamed protein product [Vitrella brassicaformis CCMP3155]|eukprot:CEM09067.1 unnamed protein product [Vitrella brassicaformis CCMP3155]